MNDWEPTFDEAELVDLALAVASGGMAKQDPVKAFESRCHPIGELSTSPLEV